jgi:outer membrane cobalamin receptor
VVNARVSASSGGSIADLLRTVPGVELDAEGGIAMRGSTSVLVLMNGTRMPLTGDALIAFHYMLLTQRASTRRTSPCLNSANRQRCCSQQPSSWR